MAKLLKIVGRTIGITVEWLLFLFIVFAFSIRFSAFQTYLGSLATSFFSKELKADFKIGQIDVVSFNKIILKDVFVKDQSNDTLALLKSIDVLDVGFSDCFSGLFTLCAKLVAFCEILSLPSVT